MKTFAPESCHEYMFDNMPLELAFKPERDYETWRQQVNMKLRELVGVIPERVDPNIRIEYEKEEEGFFEKRFVFASEPGADVPCHLLIPKTGQAPHPIVICLQGHSTGMHNSLGRAKFDGDAEGIEHYDRDFAIQAVNEGYAALVMEQRCFGEREDQRAAELRHVARTCRHASLVALMLGRTMVGERSWDVSRAIDMLAEFSEVDTGRVGLMGNSGGGTITYFASCLDSRISIAMPSCYVCTFRDSIGTIDHCSCNYIPNILRYFEMADLACLIAPRPLIVVAGRQDTIFPIDAVERTFETIQNIYAAAGVPDRCRLVVGEKGHQFYARQSWPVFRELAGW